MKKAIGDEQMATIAKNTLRHIAAHGYSQRERRRGTDFVARFKRDRAKVEARKAWAERRIAEGTLEASAHDLLVLKLIRYLAEGGHFEYYTPRPPR